MTARWSASDSAAADVDAVHQGCGVVLERARRVLDVADLGRERTAEVLTVEQPLHLALHVLVDVDALGVDERDRDRLRVVGDEAHGDAPLGADRPHLEPGERDRGRLEVDDVDACRVEPDHHGPLERPASPARVP